MMSVSESSSRESSLPILHQIEQLYRLKNDIDSLVKQLNLQNCFLERVAKFRHYLKENFSIDFADDDELIALESETVAGQMMLNFQREFDKFDRHYRHFERNSKVANKLTTAANWNPHDTLYELYQSIVLVEVNLDNDDDCKNILQIDVPNDRRFAEKPRIQCEFEGCQFVARGRAGLRHHQRVHNPDKRFRCKIGGCDFESNNLVEQNRHKLTCHKTIMNKFRCEHRGCEYRAPYRHQLIKHRLSHQSERNFKCDFVGCEYASKRIGDLNFHKLTHCPEQQYRCDFEGCGYSSNWPKNLKTHRLSHNPEQLVRCDFEGCTFVSKWATNLCQHKKIHDQRPNRREFRCDHLGCQYVTKWSSDLKKHKRIHSGELPYRCGQCEFKAKRLDGLKTHQKRRHPIKQEEVD